MQHKSVHAALVTIVAMWGLIFVAVHELLDTLDSAQLVTIRFAMISVIFVAIFIAVPSTAPRLVRQDWLVLMAAGVLAVPGAQLPVVQGQRYLAPPLVAMLMSTTPAVAAVLARLFLAERFRRLQIAGFLIALAGAVTVILVGTADRTELTVDNPWGAALTLVSPLAWAGYTVLSKSYAERYHPVAAVGTAMILGTLATVPLYPHAISALDELDGGEWAWLVYAAVGGTVIPYLVWFTALRRLSASRTAAYMYGIPLLALVWSWLILDFVPTIGALIGGIVIIVGVALTQFGGTTPRAEDRPGAGV